MAHRRYGRRAVLAGLGAAASFPFLRSVAAQAQSAVPKPRLALFVSAGWFPPWSYEGAGISSSTMVLGPSLTPLAPWIDRVRIVRGLADRPGHEKYNFQNAHDGVGYWLLHGDAADSVDNKVGEVLSAGAPKRAYAWATHGWKNYYRRYRGATEGGETDPRRTYDSYFAKLGSGGVVAPPTLERNRQEARLRALEAVEQASKRLGERLSGAHKRQIMAYVDGVGELRTDTPIAPMQAGTACVAPATKDARPIGDYNEPTKSPTIYPKLVRAEVDSAAAFHICGITNVTSVFFNTDDNWPHTPYDFVEGIGLNPSPWMGDHDISHNAGNGNEAGRRKTLAQQWMVSEIAHFCQQLQAVPAGAGGRTMLDDTLVVYVQAFGNSSHGRLGHMALLIGDPKSALRPSTKYINFKDQRTMGDLWATVNAALTGTAAAFGPNSTGPLGDILR